MGIYYIFNIALLETITNAFAQKQGDGFFAWVIAQKNVRQTSLPQSNVNPTPIIEVRNVMILEVKSWAPQDAMLQAEAEQAAEFWSNDNTLILEYLQSYDIV